MDNTLKKTSTIEKICWIILVTSLVLKIIYAIKVGYHCSPHDLGKIATFDKAGQGHLGYMQYLYMFREFPDSYGGQLYHPPLFHVMGAMIMSLLHVTDNYVFAFEVIQMINMFFAWIATVFCYLILKKIDVDKKFLVIGTAFIAFCPAFYIIGAELNNDCFVTLFIIASIYYALCWVQESSTKNILKIAFAIILAMLSKTSGVIVAFAIGICFLVKLFMEKDDILKYIKQYIIFGIVCIPCGLSWVIYHKIKFNIPFNYVYKMKETSGQYVGNCSLISRIGFPRIEELLSYRIDFNNLHDYNSNVWGQMFITMNFDEGILKIDNVIEKILAIALLWISIVITILLLVSVIKNLKSPLVRIEYKILFPINYLIFLGSFVKFAFDYPQVCTMNFRYIVATLLLLIVNGGLQRKTNIRVSRAECFLDSAIIVQSIISSVLYFGCAI